MLQASMSKFLKSRTVYRSYHHVTKASVEADNKDEHARREVERLVGNDLNSMLSCYQLLAFDFRCLQVQTGLYNWRRV
jgi:hypothetical protein